MKHHRPPLLVFADDWGRHPSSCQHLIVQLLDRHEVLWVDTIGMRRPGLDRVTFTRGLEKLGRWLRPSGRQLRDGRRSASEADLHVLNPLMWPSFSSGLERRINRELLVKQLLPHLAALPEPPIAVTNIPIVADIVGRLPVRRWVYYCVDDLVEWPGLDGTALRAMEERLIERCDVLIAVSPVLQERLGRRRQPVHLLTHGVDLEHWGGCNAATPGRSAEHAGDDPGGLPATRSLEGLERPLIVFWGVIDRRMDVNLLERLATSLTEGTIVLIGPQSDPDPALTRLPRVVLHPPVPFAVLPAIARAARVLIMPYADLPVTRAMQPLKLKEYLATGKPVVVRDLPATRPWADAMDMVDSPEAFCRAVRERLVTDVPAPQRRARARLAEESWAAKARALERWISVDAEAMQAEATETCREPSPELGGYLA